jgi:hypothetical protein
LEVDAGVGTNPTVAFNGGNLLRRTTWTDLPEGSDEAFTVLAVLRSGANQNGSPIAWWSNTSVGAVRCSVVTSGGNSFFNLARDDDSWGTQSHSSTADIGTGRHVVAWRFSPEVMKVTVDGTTYTSSSQSSLDNISLTHLIIGARSDLPTWLFQGDISEIAVIPGSISDAEVSNFREYAEMVWGGLP